MQQITLLFAFIAIIAWGCSSNNEPEAQKNEEENTEKAENPMEQMANEMKKVQENMQGGNTHKVLSYKELQEYLPEEIDGYKGGELDGSSMSMSGMTYSVASRDYTKGEETFSVQIMDYSNAMALYTAAMATMNMSFENDEEYVRSISINDNMKGFEQFNKIDNDAAITIGISNRFYLHINAENQKDTDFVKSIANNFEDLSNI